MKNNIQYNRFIQFANAPVCIYGSTRMRNSLIRGRKPMLKKLFILVLKRSSG